MFCCWRLPARHRDTECEFRAICSIAGHLNVPLVVFDDAFCDGQAESASVLTRLILGFVGKESTKDLGKILRGYSRAVVADPDENGSVVLLLVP